MKQLLFTGLILLATMQATGQTQNVDSLMNVLKTHSLSKKEQFDLYLTILQSTGDSKIHLYCINTGLPLAQKEKNKMMESVFNEYIGRFYVARAMCDSAFIFFDKALKLAIESKDSRQESSVYTAIGVTYGYQGMYKELIEYQLKALKIHEEANDKQGIQSALSNIGNAYSALNDNESALKYQEQALALAEELNLTYSISTAHYGLATTNFSLKNFGKAENHLLKALELSREEHGSQVTTGFILIALQELYSEGIVDLEKAEMYGKEGLEIAERFHNPSLKANAYKGMADIYRVQGRYRDCDISATKSWEIDSVNIDLTISTTANLTLANIHLGNKQKALLFFDKYYNIVKKYNEKSLHESVVAQNVKYETEKKEIRITSLEKERQLYVWLGISASVIALSLVIVLLLIIRNARKEKQLIAARAVQDGEIGERARIAEDLHDRLGGSLSAVKIELKNAESLQNVSDKLEDCIKEVREITHNLMPRSLRTSGMKTALEDFAVQFPNVHFHFFGEEKRVKERLEFIVYCCASELITNAIRYSNAKDINVQLIQDEKHISLIVQDDGCGYDENTTTKGIGLKNIHDRVASCNGKLDIITSPGKGTETIIELRIEN